MADEILTTLGFETGRSRANVLELAATLRRLESSLRSTANTTRASNRALEGFDPAVNRANAAFRRLQRSSAGLRRDLSDTERRLRNTFRGASASAAAATGSFDRLGSVIQTSLGVGAFFAFTAAMREATSAALEFELQIAEIQTISGGALGSLEDIRREAIRVSNAFGAPLEQVAEGTYQILSNQVVDSADAFRLQEQAQILATATASENADAVAGLSSVINAYNLSIEDADEISDKLFRTVEQGRLRLGQLGNTIGRVADSAALLGVDLDELLAGQASLTLSGLSLSEAQTRLRGIFNGLLKPTDELAAVLRDLGIESAEAGIATFGFVGLLQQLVTATNGSEEALAQLFPRIRGFEGVIALATSRNEQFNDALNAISDSAGAAEDAFNIVFETNAAQVRREFTQLRNVLVESGQAVIDVGAFFLRAARDLGEFDSAAEALFFRLFGIFGLIAEVGTRQQVLSNRAIAAAREAAEEAGNIDRGFAEQLVKNQEQAFAQREQIIRQALARETAAFANRADVRRLRGLESLIFEDALGATENRLQAFESIVESIEEAGRRTRQEIDRINDRLQDISAQREEFFFDRSLRGLSDEQQATRVRQRASELARQSNAALLRGDLERAEALAEQSTELAIQGSRLADNTENFLLQRQAVSQVNAGFQLQEQVQKRLLANQRREAQLAEQTSSEAARRRDNLTALTQDLERQTKITQDQTKSADERRQAEENIKQLQEDILREQAGLLQIVSPFASLNEELAGFIQEASQPIPIVFSSNLEAIRAQLEQLGQRALGADLTRSLERLGVEGPTLADPEAILTQLSDTRELNQQNLEFIRAQNEQQARQVELVEEVRRNLLATGQALTQAIRESEEGAGTGALADAASRLRSEGETLRRDFLNIDINTVQGREQLELLEDQIRDFATRVEAVLDPLTIDIPFLDARFEFGGNLTAVQSAANAANTLFELQQLGPLAPFDNEQALRSQRIIGDVAVGFSTLQTTAVGSQNAIESATNRANAALQRQRELTGTLLVPPTGRRFGGPLFRQAGGFVRGTDNILASLGSGESVNTRSATRRFLPQIQAMNAPGSRPLFRERGGTVNTTVGDTNVNITIQESQNAQATARAVAGQINREQRRGTFNLRRSK